MLMKTEYKNINVKLHNNLTAGVMRMFGMYKQGHDPRKPQTAISHYWHVYTSTNFVLPNKRNADEAWFIDTNSFPQFVPTLPYSISQWPKDTFSREAV